MSSPFDIDIWYVLETEPQSMHSLETPNFKCHVFLLQETYTVQSALSHSVQSFLHKEQQRVDTVHVDSAGLL